MVIREDFVGGDGAVSSLFSTDPANPLPFSEEVEQCRRLQVENLLVSAPYAGDGGAEAIKWLNDVSWLTELADQLTSLGVGLIFPRGVESWGAFPRVTKLGIGGWKGRLDFGNFPALEQFSTDGGGPGIETLWESSVLLKHLWFHRFKGEDLNCLANLALKSLSVTNSRKLERLEGIESQAESLKFLELELDTKLSDLAGLEAVRELEFLHLNTCNRVTDLSALADLSNLKYLVLTENKNLGSIEPLFGLESLEVLHLPHDIDDNLRPLLEMPNLRYVSQGLRRAVKDGLVLPSSQEALEESHKFRSRSTELDPN